MWGWSWRRYQELNGPDTARDRAVNKDSAPSGVKLAPETGVSQIRPSLTVRSCEVWLTIGTWGAAGDGVDERGRGCKGRTCQRGSELYRSMGPNCPEVLIKGLLLVPYTDDDDDYNNKNNNNNLNNLYRASDSKADEAYTRSAEGGGQALFWCLHKFGSKWTVHGAR